MPKLLLERERESDSMRVELVEHWTNDTLLMQ